MPGLGKQLIPQLPRLRQRLPLLVRCQPLAARFLFRLRGMLALMQIVQRGARRLVSLVGGQGASLRLAMRRHVRRHAGVERLGPVKQGRRIALRRFPGQQGRCRLLHGLRQLRLAGDGLRRLRARRFQRGARAGDLAGQARHIVDQGPRRLQQFPLRQRRAAFLRGGPFGIGVIERLLRGRHLGLQLVRFLVPALLQFQHRLAQVDGLQGGFGRAA
ncbi:hypothetical protein JAB5_28830 [Janthinobacterium sp. HH103]|nr:hypothetical protein JAB5_28830 [Janthinobacterium sp. HH103]